MKHLLVVTLVLVGVGIAGLAWEYNEDFEGVIPPNLPGPPAAWTAPPGAWGLPGLDLWSTVSSGHLFNEPPEVRDFSQALYFGKADSAKGTGSYETVSVPDGGCVISPELVSYGLAEGQWIRVRFRYYREVEQGTPGYDETVIYLVFINGAGEFWDPEPGWQAAFAGVPIFKKDSGDPPEGSWQEFVSKPVQVPQGTVRAYLLFWFRPRDSFYNDYLGWLVDDVRVYNIPIITTSSLPPATRGDAYHAVIDAEGGASPYTWSIDPSTPLPKGLSFSQADDDGDGIDEAVIGRIPEEAGVFPIRVTVTDAEGHKDTKDFILVVTEPGAPSAAITVTFDDGLPTGWSASGLWHWTSSVVYNGTNIAPDPVMYFGVPGQNSYDTGKAESGELISEQFPVTSYRGMQVQIQFDYWREVESYAAGSFDQTYVEYRFNNTDWKQVWFADSTVPSGKLWKTTPPIEIDFDGQAIIVPEDADWFQIKFVFDTVDAMNNDYVGWLINNLRISFVPATLKITSPANLPDAELNTPYNYSLEASGGLPPYRWSVGRGLPLGLSLNPRTGEIYGTPTQAGSYQFEVTVTDADGNTASKVFTLTVNRKVSLFYDGFENGFGNWDTSNAGLWHLTDQVLGVSDIQGTVAYFGKDDATAPNYATGSRAMGEIVTKAFDVTNVTAFELSFRYWREVEYYVNGGYDIASVAVRFKVGGAWTDWNVLWQKDCADPSAKDWITEKIGPYLFPTGATEMQVKFAFDSVDEFYNNYIGWLVDEVRVSIATSGNPLPSSIVEPTVVRPRGGIEFFNIPNPIRDVHTTVFGVRGVDADLIRVEIYDLAGRLVWKGEAPGNELIWHTEDLSGQYLANGVYFYVIYVKVGNTWIQSDIRKLAIYR